MYKHLIAVHDFMKASSPQAAMYFCLICFGLCSSALASSNSQSDLTPTGVASLAKFKSEAEDWSATFKKDSKIDPAVRAKAEQLYIAARGSVNAWIVQYKWALAHNDLDPKSADYKTTLAAAIADGQAYVDHVNKVYVRGSISSQAVTLIGMVQKILTDFITMLKGAKDDEKKATIALLDSLQWKAWDS
jgi:hypothetical protein